MHQHSRDSELLVEVRIYSFLTKKTLHDVDGFEKSYSLGTLRIFFVAVPHFFSSSHTLYLFPSSNSCKVNLTYFFAAILFFILMFCQFVVTDEFGVYYLCLFAVQR
jgi:hypothetical protein